MFGRIILYLNSKNKRLFGKTGFFLLLQDQRKFIDLDLRIYDSTELALVFNFLIKISDVLERILPVVFI